MSKIFDILRPQAKWFTATPNARVTFGNGVRTWVLGTDKDPFNQGLNKRSEIHIKREITQLSFNKFFELTGDFQVSKNVTFIQIMGRNDLNQGKPIFVLDTHDGIVHIRLRNFKYAERMERIKLCDHKGKDSSISFSIRFNLANQGYIRINLSHAGTVISRVFNQPLRWRNSSQPLISLGTYMTRSPNTSGVIGETICKSLVLYDGFVSPKEK